MVERSHSPIKSTSFHNSKARVLVYTHESLSKYFREDKFDQADLMLGLPESRAALAESFRGPVDEKRDALLNELKVNSAKFIQYLLLSKDIPQIEITKDIIRLQHTKTIGSPVGSFSMTLTREQGNQYLLELNSDDLVLIELDNGSADGEEYALVNVCLIDRVAEHRSATNTFATTSLVNVSGRDLGKVLLETSVFVDKDFFNIEIAARYFDTKNPIFQDPSHVLGLVGNPSDNVVDIFKGFSQVRVNSSAFTNSESAKGQDFAKVLRGAQPIQQFVFPGNTGVNLADLIDTRLEKDGGFIGETIGGLAEVILPNAESTVWHLMDQFANRLVNEMFLDVREVPVQEDAKAKDQAGIIDLPGHELDYRVALILRQMPFDKQAFDKLPVHEIEDYEVTEFEFGKSSHNVRNVFRTWIFNHGIASLMEQRWPLRINLESVARHGLKHNLAESSYGWPTAIPGAEGSSADEKNRKSEAARQSAFTIANRYLELISTWNAVNEDFLEGTLTCRLRPQIRIGQRVRFFTFDGDVIEFYVEGVHHDFQYPGPSMTTLTLTRGIPKKVQGIDPKLAVDRLVLGQLDQIGPTFVGFNPLSGVASIGGGTEETVPTAAAPVANVKAIKVTPFTAKNEDAIKTLCEKYKTTNVPASYLYGVCWAETDAGAPGSRTKEHPGPPVSTARGIMQVTQTTANDPPIHSTPEPPFTYSLPVVKQNFIDSDDLSMLVGAKVLNNYFAQLRSAKGSDPTIRELYISYTRGIGVGKRLVTGTATATDLAGIASVNGRIVIAVEKQAYYFPPPVLVASAP